MLFLGFHTTLAFALVENVGLKFLARIFGTHVCVPLKEAQLFPSFPEKLSQVQMRPGFIHNHPVVSCCDSNGVCYSYLRMNHRWKSLINCQFFPHSTGDKTSSSLTTHLTRFYLRLNMTYFQPITSEVLSILALSPQN